MVYQSMQAELCAVTLLYCVSMAWRLVLLGFI